MKIVGPSSYSSSTCCVKISKKKNKNSIRSRLPKITMLPKNTVWFFRGFNRPIKLPQSFFGGVVFPLLIEKYRELVVLAFLYIFVTFSSFLNASKLQINDLVSFNPRKTQGAL